MASPGAAPRSIPLAPDPARRGARAGRASPSTPRAVAGRRRADSARACDAPRPARSRRCREVFSSSIVRNSSCVSPAFRRTRPACPARSATSFSSVAVSDSPGRFSIDSAPSSSPRCRTGSNIDVAVTSLADPPRVGSAGPRSVRPARLRMELVTGADPDIGPPGAGPLGERARHPRQEFVVRIGLSDAVRELGQDLVRRRAFAVDEAVGDALRAGAAAGTRAPRRPRRRRRGTGSPGSRRASPPRRRSPRRRP